MSAQRAREAVRERISTERELARCRLSREDAAAVRRFYRSNRDLGVSYLAGALREHMISTALSERTETP